MKRDLDKLRVSNRGFLEDKKLKEDLLDLYSENVYKQFQAGILQPELNRLAHQRMNIQAEDRYLHERIQGQYNEIQRLLTQPKELSEEIMVLSDKTRIIGKQISKLERRLSKQKT